MAVSVTSASGPPSGGGLGSGNSTGSGGSGGFSPSFSVATLPVGKSPEFVTNDSGNGYFYVPNPGSSNVSVFKGSTATTVSAGTKPLLATYDPKHGLVYVTNSGTDSSGVGSVTVINGTTPQTVSVGAYPWFATYDPANGYVYVPNSGGASVTVLNGISLVKTLNVGSTPYAVVFDPRNDYVYVLNYGSSSVSIFNGTSGIGSNGDYNYSVGSEPLTGVYDSSNGFVYIANWAGDSVTIMNGTSTVATPGVAANPHSATFDPQNGYVYVPAGGAGDVSVINGTSFVTSIGVGVAPIFAAYDPGNGYVYVANSGGSTVSVISGLAVISGGTVTVGSYPHSATYNPGDGNVFVPNSASGADTSVSMIGPGPTVAGCQSPSSVTVKVMNRYQQASISWTDPTKSATSFAWGYTTGFSTTYNLPVASINNTSYTYSVNLNALNSSTTYQYVISLASACSGAATPGATTGSILSGAAPAGIAGLGFAGWVYQEESPLKSWQINPLGASKTSASIEVGEWCYSVNVNGLLFGSAGPLNITATSTNASGYYQFTFPVLYNVFYAGSTVNFMMLASGTCVTTIYPTHGASYNDTWSNPYYRLIANDSGSFTAQREMSDSASHLGVNDFQQFALPVDFGANVPLALALIHTAYGNGNPRDNTACALTYYTSTSIANVSQGISLNGQKAATEYGNVTSGWNVQGGYGTSIGLTLKYPFSGLIDYNALTRSALKNSTWVNGPEYGAGSVPYNNTTEWMSTPTYTPSTVAPAGWVYSYALSGGPVQRILFTTGTYSATTGYNVALGISVGWFGQSISASIPIQATTDVTTSITNTVQCTYNYTSDANGLGGDPYFWSYFGSPAASIVHTWLVGWCDGRSPEPAC